MQGILKNKINDLKRICLLLGVKRLYAFGSVVSNKFRDDSDIDFLISFRDNLSIEEYTDNYFKLQYQLREMFKRKIDIVTERTLSNPYFIESIEETKEFSEEPCVEELADILEVVNAISDLKFGGINEVEKIRREKSEKRGGFEKRFILEETDNR
jgi:predicted nucleotidyltransferase